MSERGSVISVDEERVGGASGEDVGAMTDHDQGHPSRATELIERVEDPFILHCQRRARPPDWPQIASSARDVTLLLREDRGNCA